MLTRFIRILFTSLIIFGGVSNTLAQVKTAPTITTDTTKTELLRELIVTAQRSQQQEFNTAGSVKVLNSKSLRTYQARTTPEALFGVNGVFVQKTNHGGGSPFMRGLTGNQTLILIDGIRLNNSTFRYGPNQYLNTIDALSLDRIEVLKGSGSVQYGTDALGGTIQLFSAEPEFGQRQTRGNLLTRWATHGMERSFRGEATHSGERTAWNVGITQRHFGDLVGGDTTGRQSPSGYDEWAFNAKGKFALSKKLTLTVAQQYLQQNHVPVYHKVKLENFAINEFEPQRRNLSYARLEGNFDHKSFKKITAIASYQTTYEGRLSQKNGSTTLRTEIDKVKTKGLTFNVLSELSKKWTANSGVEVYADLVNSTKDDFNQATNQNKASRGLYPDGSTYLNYALYSLHQWQTGPWQLTFGGRFNGFSINVSDETLGKTNLNPKALVGNAAVLYGLSKSSNLYVSVNSGFRAPNVDDLGTLGIVDFRYELPTNNLKPEKSVNFEVGYKLRTPRVAAGLYLFRNNLRDLITRVKVEGQVISGYNVYRKENVEEAYIQGLETELETILSSTLRVYGSLAYAYGQNVTKNEPVRRIPPLNGKIGINWQSNNWFVRPEFIFASSQDRLAAGDRDDNRIPKGGTPGWAIFNIHAGYENTRWLLNLNAQNLLNADYRLHGSGVNGVGRSAGLTVALKL